MTKSLASNQVRLRKFIVHIQNKSVLLCLGENWEYVLCQSCYYLISTLIVYSNQAEIRVNLVNLVQTALLIAVLMKKFQLALYIVQYANFQQTSADG